MTKVKICGLTQARHVEAAVAAGADYLGFVFAKSRRLITPASVKEITHHVPQTVHKVGVFVQPTFAEIKAAYVNAGISHVQLHGQLTDSVQQALTEGAFQQLHLSVIHAFNGESPDLHKELAGSKADFVLLDAPADTTGYAGGNGRAFNWSVVAKKAQIDKPLFIAGGLHQGNVQQAIQYFSPFAVDVSSGVETNGEKDAKKITTFIRKVKELSVNETTNK